MRLAPAIRLLQAPLGGWVVPRVHISAKPAKTPTSASVSTSQAAAVGWGGAALRCSWEVVSGWDMGETERAQAWSFLRGSWGCQSYGWDRVPTPGKGSLQPSPAGQRPEAASSQSGGWGSGAQNPLSFGQMTGAKG